MVFGTYLLIYAFLYIIGYLTKAIFKTDEEKEHYWNIFTRCVSFFNAWSCIVTIYQYIIPNIGSYASLMAGGDDEFVNDLFRFSAYLFVDGIFDLSRLIKNPNTDAITSFLHHFIGGLGIFIIATHRQGLGLGAYFSATEISTPLLHISWILYTNKINGLFTTIIFGSFYIVFTVSRILTIPLLSYYLWINYNITATVQIFHRFMVYFGCGSLMTLNILWFIMLTIKIANLLGCLQTNKSECKLNQD